MAGNQTDDGRAVGHDRMCVGRCLLRVLHRDDPTGIHKNWRQTDSQTPHGGGSLGAIGKAPRPAGKTWEEERALLGMVSSGARLEPWL